MDNLENQSSVCSPFGKSEREIPRLTDTTAPTTATEAGGRDISPTPDNPNAQPYRDTFMALRNDAPADASRSGVDLLNALWRSPENCHQFGTFDRKTRVFKNHPATSAAQAVTSALALSAAGTETYFACAEYRSGESRKAENASGAWAFWMDLDCGGEKFSAGIGYFLKERAFEELTMFCNETGIPRPTHIVSSGGGIHAYWVVDRFVPREDWQEYARMFKELADRWGLRADATRTADIASVLRIPGTLNHKYTPPKPVVLHFAAADPIDRDGFLGAIEAEHELICGAGATSTSTEVANAVLARVAKKRVGRAPNMKKLSSALAVLDTECDEPTWALKRIAPLARAAREYPELRDELYMLARHWSCGNLGGIGSRAWEVTGGNGMTGKKYFEVLWKRFLTEVPPENGFTLGTIYFDAQQGGYFHPADYLDEPATETGEAE